jgi:hypothetical protein
MFGDTLSRRELLEITAGSAGSTISFPILGNAASHESAHLNHVSSFRNRAPILPKQENFWTASHFGLAGHGFLPFDSPEEFRIHGSSRRDFRRFVYHKQA